MNSIQSLMQTIEETKALATENVEPGDFPATFPARMGRKRSAEVKLRDLMLQYRKELLGRAVFILSTGTGHKKFAGVAKEFDCFTYSVDSFYEGLVDRMDPSFYNGKQGLTSFVDVLSRILEDVAYEIDIASYPALVYDSKMATTVDTKAKAVEFAKKIINEKVGSEIALYHALDSISKEAVNKGFKGNILPLVLYTKDVDLADTLLKDSKVARLRAFKVVSGVSSKKDGENAVCNIHKKIDNKAVGEALTKIRESI